ncbi:hypothetical protein DL764_006477 [Monosporascus ibericus]|uniref:Uncharacterized protein n=1 Tax=Monosporascus ibericus TaxID=155417 RepID=A0A4Q4T4M5_9PEZI|nr:hypothetical protein DL764_006477 [Monosporascus ibericus]
MQLKSLVLLPLLGASALAECRKNRGNRTRTGRPSKQSSTVLLQSTDEVALPSFVPAPFDPPQADEKAQTTEVVVTPTTSAARQPTSEVTQETSIVAPVVESPAVETPEAETIPAKDPVAEALVVESSSAVAPLSASSAQQGPPAPAKTYCGTPNDSEVLFGTPWIVFSMNYNQQSIKGSSCTGLYETTGSGNGQRIHWSSDFQIDPNFDRNVVKGYSFVGLTQGLETRLTDIKSIPSTFNWKIYEETEWKGNVVYDFMTSDTKGDSTSSNAQELMLWLYWNGGQVPIGWAEGPIATINNLFGKDGWKLYQGVNRDTGITVTSLLAPENNMFGNASAGAFDGDIKDWLIALSKNGVFSADTYVNVGNAGNEPYWGNVFFENKLGLRINL